MKRMISFKTAEEFSFVHQGFVIGAAQTERKTITDMRNIARILDKFDEISESVKTEVQDKEVEDLYPTGDPVRKWTSGSLVLTVDEHKLVSEYMEKVPWTTRVMREALRVLDLVRDAEECPDIVPKEK